MSEEFRRTAEFFALLLSSNLDTASAQREQLMTEFLRLIQGQMLPPSPAALAGMREIMASQGQALATGETSGLIETGHKQTLLLLLKSLHEQARAVILELLESQKATVPLYVHFTLALEGRAVKEMLQPASIAPEELRLYGLSPQGFQAISQQLGLGENTFFFTTLLLPLLRQRPFPFGKCVVCGKVFVQPRKGKARRYCSESCKAKGVPSAAKRTEYMRSQRRRKRQEEVLTARRILRAWPENEQWQMLQRTFPKKSHRQLLFLLRQAKQKRKEK